MSQQTSNPADVKLLPGGDTPAAGPITPSAQPSKQLPELPKDELELFAEEFGLDPTDYKTRQSLVAAIHERRQTIAAMDREAMLDVVRWARRPVAVNLTKEQLAKEIARIRLMRFDGLSQRGLIVLGKMRGVKIQGDEQTPILVRKLKKQEGLFKRLNRKRRSWLGGMVANMIGEEPKSEYRFLPPAEAGSPGGQSTQTATPVSAENATIRDDIEESGLIGGIANRVKKTADSYLNQKLDEIEARIDRKLDEIDQRLAEWRDKEIANRIKILKITLWVSVIVGAFSLIYSYVQVYFWRK
ncbi:MAG TPA: hypothetical protein VHS31_02870 [Tepidisphaeraceae bacterium]|jgi:hypothetical protein|nr:hypothetical protein [Tepidisphaeraceae bacterium]